MRGALTVLMQILGAAVGLAAVGGLAGFLIVHFAGLDGAAEGFGWGVIVAGGVVGFAAGGSGSPSENLVRGRADAFGTVLVAY